MNLSQLPAIAVLSDNVTIVQQGEVKIVRVIHEKAVAGIALLGGHVVSYQPTGQEDLIWMSNAAIFDGEKALRGGIPVCWPWFGRVAAPAHGFARSKEWELVEHRENEQGVIVELALFPSEDTLNIWPHLFDLRLVMEVGEELKVTLKVQNIDDHAWTFSSALHTYLNISDIEKMQVTGMGPEYIDGLQEGKICQGGETLALTAGIDRVYTKPESVIEVEDQVLNRTLKIVNAGHNSAVLWNPWIEVATDMADMENDGYKTMFCVESTIHAPTINDGITLQPNEEYELSTIISA
ncbi:hypothetical protein VII00023_19269 [Vibrio ichthyoenteri ATCC 700023]|uniref:Putative glucose-6-phosphate 1-epimerase n=1 Tax=Vibrio ichthyoenteri ATCC 700023 TaxID=870968 RepID=F9S384_9VIBR|nr:D-hexose-6-phosphate mutarotase [Vibrio ichthyoenteri]EGU38108.1 hypothetical protein VII00023_19269 [Vibrio ichthyoenteri ATCC 700023]